MGGLLLGMPRLVAGSSFSLPHTDTWGGGRMSELQIVGEGGGG